MRRKLIALEVVLLVVFAGFYVWSLQQEPEPTEVGTGEDQPVFANLNVSKISTIELKGGEEEIVLRKVPEQDQQSGQQGGTQGQQQQQQQSTSSVQPTMDKGPYRADYEPKWVLASYHNYGVQGDQVQNRILKPLRKLKRGTVQAREKANLNRFGLDPSNRRRIVLKDDSNNIVREVVLGKRVTGYTESGPGQFGGGGSDQESIYYYNATNQDKFEIRLGRSEFSELPLDTQEWVNKDILSYDQEEVPLIALKQQDKLYVLRRNESSEDSQSSDQNNGSDGQTSGDDDSSGSEPQWKLFTGDYYADGLLPRNAPVLWENQQLKWKGQGGKVQSIPLTKRNLNQNEAEGLSSTLSSLSAERAEAPISVPAKQQNIPAEKKAKYGLNNPKTVLYLGEWRKSNQLLVFRAQFYVGTSSEDGEDVYISSLKTKDMAQRVIQSITGFGGRFGGRQAEQLIPVYALSSTDRGTIVSPGDLIKEEEDDDGSGQGDGSSNSEDTSDPSSSKETEPTGQSSQTDTEGTDSGDEASSSTSSEESSGTNGNETSSKSSSSADGDESDGSSSDN